MGFRMSHLLDSYELSTVDSGFRSGDRKKERIPSDECRENDKTEEDKKKVDEMCFFCCVLSTSETPGMALRVSMK